MPGARYRTPARPFARVCAVCVSSSPNVRGAPLRACDRSPLGLRMQSFQGIDPYTTLPDPAGRPVPLLYQGEAIAELV